MLTGYGTTHLTPARGDSHADAVVANRVSGVGAVGLGFLSGAMDDDDDEDDDKPRNPPPALVPPKSHSQPSPISAPSPPRTNVRPPPILTAGERAVHNVPLGSRAQVKVSIPNPSQPIPRPPKAAFVESRGVSPAPPLSPHPLQAPKTPIQPAFALPKGLERPVEIKFAEDSILRGNNEETLLTRNTQKGADFWRRFSVVVKDESTSKQRSSWLSKTQAHGSRMRLYIWIVSISLLIGLIGLSVLIWYFTHGKPASAPISFTGNAGEGIVTTSSSVEATTTTSKASLRTVTGGLPPANTAASAISSTSVEGAVKRFYDTLIPLASPSPVTLPTSHRRHLNRL